MPTNRRRAAPGAIYAIAPSPPAGVEFKLLSRLSASNVPKLYQQTNSHTSSLCTMGRLTDYIFLGSSKWLPAVAPMELLNLSSPLQQNFNRFYKWETLLRPRHCCLGNSPTQVAARTPGPAGVPPFRYQGSLFKELVTATSLPTGINFSDSQYRHWPRRAALGAVPAQIAGLVDRHCQLITGRTRRRLLHQHQIPNFSTIIQFSFSSPELSLPAARERQVNNITTIING